MPNNSDKKRGLRRGAPDESVGSLASQALSVLASRRAGKPPGMSERFLQALEQAVCKGGQHDRDLVIREMASAGIAREDIADLYVPMVARRMGRAWCEDTMSFAEVTIGAARLQGVVRELTEDWSVGARIYDDGPNVVVIVIADEYHTLGPMLITSQLRRLGVSVRLLLGRPLAEVQAILREQAFDAVFISVAHVERLAQISAIVKMLRSQMAEPVPIVVGGPAAEEEPATKTLTGADHVSSDIREALRLCGLKDRMPAVPPSRTGG
ncbi:cobalamin B12-binding domain-containing protein [Oceaniglobus roseus]|uniref:cobalamin B12-binding domain-containing protein n=1 Tax=Oceaniglobus roseus TaxID=1737570 RepID=UPI0012FFEEC6|nr:cobalamin B12-binding domain-containing protein [Kandeliimicrobium roseum]